MIQELKDFLLKGNAFELAIAVILAGAFGAVIASLVADIIMPIIGSVFGAPDFSGIQYGPMLIGEFLNHLVNFLIVGTVLFFLVRGANKAMKKQEEEAGPSDVDLLGEIRDLLAK